jgi:hypothetical protein
MELSPEALLYDGESRWIIVQEASRPIGGVLQLLGLKPGKTAADTGRAKRAALVGDNQRKPKRLLSADRAPRLPFSGSKAIRE